MFIASAFSRKARLWIKGRRHWRLKLKEGLKHKKNVIWLHAASLGEFEQGRPLIEQIRNKFPDFSILLSFYSPSGYEIRKNYSGADYITYIPLDINRNAKDFINIVKPVMAFFIKYEFWYFHLKQLHKNNIPVYLVSGIFRPGHIFFRKYGFWFRNMLNFFTHIFVQDQFSFKLLTDAGLQNACICGDTRFDRVAENAISAKAVENIENFTEGELCIIAGSTWPADEELLISYINDPAVSAKFIIAPHEIEKDHIKQICKKLKKSFALYSEAHSVNLKDTAVMIIDNIGMLSSVYRYGKIAYIGGGFGDGIHNILEPAAAALPVVFGPKFKKFIEATVLISEGAAFPVCNIEELTDVFNLLIQDKEMLLNASEKARNFVYNNTGATDKIISTIFNDS